MLTFDPTKHEYRFNGVVMPSVTQILKAVGLSDYSHIPADTLQKAAERGHVVHEIIELYERGILDESSIDPALRGYFESYLRAKDAGLLPERPSAIEKMVYSEKYKYCGMLDQMYGDDWINDLKTVRTPQPEIELQLSAYWFAEHPIPICPRKLTGTYLHEDGSIADVVEYRYNTPVWCSALSVYRWKEKHGKL